MNNHLHLQSRHSHLGLKPGQVVFLKVLGPGMLQIQTEISQSSSHDAGGGGGGGEPSAGISNVRGNPKPPKSR